MSLLRSLPFLKRGKPGAEERTTQTSGGVTVINRNGNIVIRGPVRSISINGRLLRVPERILKAGS